MAVLTDLLERLLSEKVVNLGLGALMNVWRHYAY